MIGLFCVLSKKSLKNNYKSIFSPIKKNVVVDEIELKNGYFRRVTLAKFMDDKIFLQNEDVVVIVDGVILNSDDLLKKYQYDSLSNLVINKYQENKLIELIKEFRGTFEGIVYDKVKGELICFTDQLATRPLFYYQDSTICLISSEIKQIVEYLKQNDCKYTLSLVGAYCMLTYGYMYGDYTLIQEVRRIKEGKFVKFSQGTLNIEEYYSIKIEEKAISEEVAIEKLDELFIKAVELQYKKNEKYGYDNYVPLSAGLDCRMTSYVLNRFTHDITNITYSETGQLDEIVPQKMASQQKNRWIFKSLDNGLDLTHIQESCWLSDSLVNYIWPAQLNDFMREFDTSNWGIVHTGVIGDVILGSWYLTKENKKLYKLGDGAFSVKLLHYLVKYLNIADQDYELGLFSNRAINGACLGYSTTFRYYTEALSPFMNIDFMEFCLSLPNEMRRFHKLYYNWVLKKYPNAAKFAHNGKKICKDKTITIRNKDIRIGAIPSLVKRRISQSIKKDYGMNPLDLWYQQNEQVKIHLDSYYEKNRGICKKNHELYEALELLYREGNTREKSLVISLIASIKMLF